LVTVDEGAAVTRHLWIVGPGRLGLAIGSLLLRGEAVQELTFSGRGPAPAHPVFQHDRVGFRDAAAVPIDAPTAILITVPDTAVAGVALELSQRGFPRTLPVLHTSGALGGEPLAPLRQAGHPTGSLHPLASVTDSAAEQRLAGAWFGVEGDPEARELADRIVSALKGFRLDVDAGSKPVYHAAAVFASNYVVTLLSVAERLLVKSGVAGADARAATAALAAGAVANCSERGAAAALTGPIARGDVGTVRLHLERLSGPERALYSVLAAQTLELAREAGLDPGVAAELANLVEEET
jgi:predicted short-subunit dehydrogenase-like oxidoreductase (DUF2520 family)